MSAAGGNVRHDGGLSLVEMLVALAISSVVGAVFTTGVLQIYRTATAAEADSITQSQLSQALLRVDKSLRYAYSIGAAHIEGTTPYVEYLVMTADPGQSSYSKSCVQLRLAGSAPNLQLQTRSWSLASPGTPSAWTPLASNLAAVAGSAPFVRTQPTTALNHQLLTIRLAAQSGTAAKTSALTFTALNTYSSTALDSAGNSLAVTAEPCYNAAART
jgi:prepilin-type N-terminal cleavage/methylation domain-containing protein